MPTANKNMSNNNKNINSKTSSDMGSVPDPNIRHHIANIGPNTGPVTSLNQWLSKG